MVTNPLITAYTFFAGFIGLLPTFVLNFFVDMMIFAVIISVVNSFRH